MPLQRLSGEVLSDTLLHLRGWSMVEEQSAIAKEFEFGDFSSAFAFMTRGALMAEKLDHHPEGAMSTIAST
jgi:4a-hydroxytetrahydrobiopterin dehydratase